MIEFNFEIDDLVSVWPLVIKNDAILLFDLADNERGCAISQVGITSLALLRLAFAHHLLRVLVELVRKSDVRVHVYFESFIYIQDVDHGLNRFGVVVNVSM